MDNKEIFFRLLFGRSQGYLSLAYINPKTKAFKEKYFLYPEDLKKAVEDININSRGNNAYFCPQLFKTGTKGSRKKANVVDANCAWADLDACHPDLIEVRPSIAIESSPHRYQAYWLFEDPIEPHIAEDISNRIAYAHQKDGADTSGWDLTQLLRVPETPNFKYTGVEVQTLFAENVTYTPETFKQYRPFTLFDYNEEPMPDISEIGAAETLEYHATRLSPLVFRYFESKPDKDTDWSDNLWALELLLFEAGFDKKTVFAVVADAACNKYRRDNRPAEHLWREVCRASDQVKLNKEVMVNKPFELVTLMTDKEREHVASLPKTFVERYIEWAGDLTDAARQYHQAGAFIILSALLSGNVVLPTAYGKIIPNLWFMILADTTLTRKSTAMDICTDLLDEVDPEAVMATDGTLEGLMTIMAGRPGEPSVFLRDEFSGLLESMLKKDYMAGMAEMLTKLYDGRVMKRILRKESIEIRDPRLIVFAGGIKSKITALLNFEHVSSGFLPRFVFITAESDIKKVRPLGPPEYISVKDREALLVEMRSIYDTYGRPQQIVIGETKTSWSENITREAELTPKAWKRYALLESQLTTIGIESDMPSIMTPVGDRLSKSILKAAVLIAAANTAKPGSKLMVTEDDILRAIKYGEAWRTYAEEVIGQVGQSQYEKKIVEIENFVRMHGTTGVNRAKILRQFKLTARQGTEVINTMTERNLMTSKIEGKVVTYFVH